MNDDLPYKTVDGIKCFSPAAASQYDNYPDECFDVTDRGGDSSFWVRSRNRLFKKLVQRYIKAESENTFLEVGCGTGEFLKHIASDPRLKITGSEVYLKGLKYAKKNLPDVEFIQLDIAENVTSEKYDMIAAFDVLEHVECDIDAIGNVKKMLKHDGVFIVSVPQHQFLWSHLDVIVKHKRRYSRRDLVKKIEQSGLQVHRVTSFLFLLFPLMVASRLLDKGDDMSGGDDAQLEKRVKFPPVVNWIFDLLMRVDELLIHCGVSLPWGGTLLIVAKNKT